jgi:hypothetical protein
MSANFFGLYLLSKGFITEDQLIEGLENQERTNRRLGGLAVEAGLMTEKQTDLVFGRQEGDDRPFGEIAVSEQMLSRTELDNLLFRQRVNNLYLGESLLKLGHLDSEGFSDLMEEYLGLERKRSEAVSDILTSVDDYKVVLSMMQAVEKTFVRFVDKNVKLLPEADVIEAGPENVCMRFTSKVCGGCSFIFNFLLYPTSVEGLPADENAGEEVEASAGNVLYTRFFRILEGYLRTALTERDCTLQDCHVEEVSIEHWNAMHDGDMALDIVTPERRRAMVRVVRGE